MPVEYRRLPFRVRPLPDEPFDSWFEVMAHSYGVTVGEMGIALGLVGEDKQFRTTKWLAAQWATELTTSQAQRLEATTGLPAAEFHAMTRARFWRGGMREARTGGISAASPAAGLGGRFCPDCLQDSGGRWRMSWGIPMGFACLRHGRILADVCPICKLPPRRAGHPLTLVPVPGACHNRAPGATGYKQRCRADLATNDRRLEASAPVREAQRIIFRILSSGRAAFGIYVDLPQSSIHVLEDLRLLARLARHAARDRPTVMMSELDDAVVIEFLSRASPNYSERSRPEGAVNIAVGATLAVHALGDRERLIQALRGRLATSTSYVAHTPQMQEAIAVALGRRRRPSAVLQSANAPVGDPLERARKLPAVLWDSWARRLAPRRINKEIAATALSAAVVFAGTRLTHAAALALIAPSAPTRQVTHVMRELGRGSFENTTLVALLQLAHYLDANDIPIDYARRRALDCDDLLSLNAWTALCRSENVHPGGGSRHSLARVYLYQRLTGNPARPAPPSWTIAARIQDAGLREFVERMPLALSDRLDHVARSFLAAHGIDEPLIWEPPIAFLKGLEAVHAPTRGLASWPSARSARSQVDHAVPDSSDLYLAGATTADIATAAGVSRQTISRVLRDVGTPTRRGRPSHVHIDPDWLRQKYSVEKLTMPQIALLVGCTTITVNRRLHASGIPVRALGGGSEAAVLHPHPLAGHSPLLRRTLIGRNCLERARRFLVIATQPTIREAAAVLGVSQGSLGAQLHRLGRDAGGTLFTPATRGASMTLTSLGRRLARELRQVLPKCEVTGGDR